jgi:hypothetical protein
MIRRSVVLLSMLAVAGTALAQTPPSPPPPPPPAAQWHGHHPWKDAAQWRQQMEQRRMDRLALLLDLTAAQRRQVQTIFSAEHARMKSAMQQVQQAMMQARAAHRAARRETLQRLGSVLSPTQMKKLAALMPPRGMRGAMMMHGMMTHGMMMHGMGQCMGQGMGHGMGHGMGMGPPPPPGAGPQ